MGENEFTHELERAAYPHSLQATGVNTNGIVRSVGVTAPIYPMRGNVVTGIHSPLLNMLLSKKLTEFTYSFYTHSANKCELPEDVKSTLFATGSKGSKSNHLFTCQNGFSSNSHRSPR